MTTMPRMKIESVTIGLPTADLARSVAWYQRVLERDRPELEPVEGVVEFQVGPVWLQLGTDPATTVRSGAEAVVRFGVADAAVEHARLVALGIDVGELVRIDGVIEFFDFADPDGNRLSVYAELAQP